VIRVPHDLELVGVHTPEHGFQNKQVILIVIDTQNTQGPAFARIPVMVETVSYFTHNLDPVPSWLLCLSQPCATARMPPMRRPLNRDRAIW
jgi:hypothetical protein